MIFRCECGKAYTIPQYDWMKDKKKCCECGCGPSRFRMYKRAVKEESEWVPLSP